MPEWYTFATLAMGLFEKVVPMLEGLVQSFGSQPAHEAQLAAVKDAHAALTAAMPAPAAPQSDPAATTAS